MRDIVATPRTGTDQGEILPREDLLALLEQVAKEDALAAEVTFIRQLLESIAQYGICVDKRQIVSSVR